MKPRRMNWCIYPVQNSAKLKGQGVGLILYREEHQVREVANRCRCQNTAREHRSDHLFETG